MSIQETTLVEFDLAWESLLNGDPTIIEEYELEQTYSELGDEYLFGTGYESWGFF